MSEGVTLSGRKVLVVGLARTGLPLVRFLASRGARVTASEIRSRQESADVLDQVGGLLEKAEFGRHGEALFLDADLIVPSPGVRADLPAIVAAQEAGIRVVSELELASAFVSAPMIAISGTNGKTTTTSLAGAMLSADGRRVFVGGNIGRPLVSLLAEGEGADVAVVEVSSFQLEWVESFRPRVAALLNLTPDHQDRHHDMARYAGIKARLFARQTDRDAMVLNAEDPLVMEAAAGMKGRRVLFSLRGPVERGCYVDGGEIVLAAEGASPERYDLSEFRLPGLHNVQNLMAAICAVRMIGCSQDAVRQTIGTFDPLPHRLELVSEAGGVRFYNDSKATTVDSVKRSLECFDGPIVLIMGGRSKGGDFASLAGGVKSRVSRLVLYGEAAGEIERALGDCSQTYTAADFNDAVEHAFGEAGPGDVVLLSPGCASFDAFGDYQERGDAFRRIVGGLRR